MKAPYVAFGESRMLPVIVWHDGKIQDGLTEWDTTLWIERGEDWYGLSSHQLKNLRVRLIYRQDWIKAS